MSDAFKNSDLTDDEVRIGLLRLIHSAKKDDNFPGATARMLLEVGADLKSIEEAIAWLSGEDFIYVRNRRFLVTPKGLDYLDSNDEPPNDRYDG